MMLKDILFFALILHTVYAMRKGRTTKKHFAFWFMRPFKGAYKNYKAVRYHPWVITQEKKHLEKRLEKLESKIIHRKGGKK